MVKPNRYCDPAHDAPNGDRGLDVLALGRRLGLLDAARSPAEPSGSSLTHAAARGLVEVVVEADCRAACRAGVRHRLAKPNEQALENRYPSLGGSRVQIPPPPLPDPKPMQAIGSRAPAPSRFPPRSRYWTRCSRVGVGSSSQLR